MMDRNCRKIPIIFFIFLIIFLNPFFDFEVSGFALIESAGNNQSVLLSKVFIPEASGTNVIRDPVVEIDASNTSDGYLMVRYLGENHKVKLIIRTPDKVQFVYNLTAGAGYEVFNLSAGDGRYTIGVYENIEKDQYAAAFTTSLDVVLKNDFMPFLYPNQYVNYDANSSLIAIARELTIGAVTEIDQVKEIYTWVIQNFSYDPVLAKNVKSGYLPDLESFLKVRKGICFDYAALMTAMMRSLGVPTKLVVGYSGSIYHAWISIYVKETGWINDIIFFDGISWKLMDPTFASSGKSSPAIMKYIGNGKNYREKFVY